MTTTRVMVTALPYSLAADAARHLTAFVTLKLTPADPVDSELSAFPAAADWVTTALAGRWELLTDAVADPIPLEVVLGAAGPGTDPDVGAWAAVFPPGTPVAGFPAPVVSGADWNSFPAHKMSDHAVDLHLASLSAAPTSKPSVFGNPAVSGVLDRLSQLADSLQVLRRMARDRDGRSAAIVAQRMAAASASLGVRPPRGQEGYPTQDATAPSALEVLFADETFDERVTTFLDGTVGVDHTGDPETALLADAHATRRYYDRPEEQTDYRPEPTPGATAPRPDRPTPDFHARAASFGSTPVLLHRLALAVDLRLAPDAVALLANATWVAVRFVPGPDVDVTRVAPPRTHVSIQGDRFDAVSSADWVGGAVPLADEGYVLLDLDPDASGLKLDQHLRGLHRAGASEANGDAATSAPGSLRTSGFAIARTDRVAASRARTAKAESMTAADDAAGVSGPDLTYDDLVRGLRLEVWDDRTRAWHGLHDRLVTVVADPGAGPEQVLTDVPDAGFLQLSGLNRVPGSDANPYYLHEVIAGWDGWSLSAPRPGRTIVHGPDGGEDVVPEPTDEPATGVQIRTRVAPGSLPRLRWGTSYAFRLVGVDLAGGVVPRPADPGPGEPPSPAAVAAAQEHLARLGLVYARRDSRGLLSAVRQRVVDSLPRLSQQRSWATGLATEEVSHREPSDAETGHRLPDFARTGDAAIDGFLAAQVPVSQDEASASAVPPGPGAAQSLSGDETKTALGRVAGATRLLLETDAPWRVRPQLRVSAESLAAVLGGPPAPGDRVVATAPRPYLRWAPVPPPTLVAREVLSTGEQLSRLVVRTGLPAASPDAVTTSARHVVPAKTTQLDAETDGRFDAAIGSTDAERQRVAYAIALAERGTLLDTVIPSLDDANATRTQTDMSLASRPGADPATAVTLEAITLDRDTPLGEGQYVVHALDDLVIPYLPDPHAAGVALVFYDAGAPHLLSDPRVLQSVVLPFPGDWPRVEPLRLVLTAGATFGARLDGRAVTVTLPPGEQVRVAMSSSLRREDLELFGLWRSHLASTIDPDGDGTATPDQVVAAAILMRAAAAGWTWWLTPSVDLRLVHAVPAPARVPQLLTLKVLMRPPGLTVAVLAGVVDVHGASTERVVVRAAWSEWVDDVSTPGPTRVDRSDVVVSSPVGPTEHWGLLWMVDFQPFGGATSMTPMVEGSIGLHRSIATFPDTHHRTLSCTPSGVTRYAEFFAPDDVPAEDSPALAGTPVDVEVPSSARPAAAEIVEAVPLLRWEQVTEPDQPFALRRVRRSGVRVWLRRPWFSSGDGELLGVVLDGGSNAPDGTVSLWGRDPIYQTGPKISSATALPLVEPAHLLLETISGAAVERTARPVLAPVTVPLVDVVETPPARVFAYQPEFHEGRGQWFVDIAVDEGPVLWPFVRLAVARYQPSSIDGCSLSAVGLTTWVQPLPTRTTTVNRPDATHVRVTVTGVVAFLHGRDHADGGLAGGVDPIPADELDADSPTGPMLLADAFVGRSRVVTATLQELPAGATDLQWEDRGTPKRLRLAGVGDELTFRATWTGELDLPTPLPVVTPGTSATWRVLVEEQELLDADAPGIANSQGQTSIAARTIYLDTIAL